MNRQRSFDYYQFVVSLDQCSVLSRLNTPPPVMTEQFSHWLMLFSRCCTTQIQTVRRTTRPRSCIARTDASMKRKWRSSCRRAGLTTEPTDRQRVQCYWRRKHHWQLLTACATWQPLGNAWRTCQLGPKELIACCQPVAIISM